MEYVIKKKVLGGEQVCYRCMACGGELESPLTDAGAADTCPLCGKAFVVPGERELHSRKQQAQENRAKAERASAEKEREIEARRLQDVRLEAERRLADDMAEQGISYEGKLSFEGSWTPQVRLLQDERVIDVFEASVWDLGLLGSLLGHKRRLVLTTHRLFRFDKRVVDCRLQILWLAQVKAVSVGQSLHGGRAILGLLFALCGIWLAWRAPLLGVGSTVNVVATVLLFATAGVLLVLARSKVMVASTGDDKASIAMIRLAREESSRFVNKVFLRLQSS